MKKLRFQEWLKEDKEEGCTRANVQYLRGLKDVDRQLAIIAQMNYFLLTKLNIKNCGTMMWSAKKQRSLLYAVMQEVKKYKVEGEWCKVFDREIKAIQSRCAHVYKIALENMRLTEYYPFFEEHGFEILLEHDGIYREYGTTQHDDLIPIIEEWNRRNADIVEEHMKATEFRRKAHEKHVANKSAVYRTEKDLEKLMKQFERAREKEIEKNEKAHESRKKKIEKSMEYMYK